MKPIFKIIVGPSPNLAEKHDQLIDLPDRFSALPENLIHHIFSFLQMEDICRIGILSRRLRQLYMSSPYLYFSITDSDSPPYGRSRRKFWRTHLGSKPCYRNCWKFRRFLDRFFGQRNRFPIQCFRLCWHCLNSKNFKEGSSLDAWIDHLVQFNIQELDLELDWTGAFYYSDEEDVSDEEDGKILDVFVLPRSIFSCPSLRVLKLDIPSISLLRLPSMPLNSLEVLSLHQMSFGDDFCLGGWISTYCPVLKKLSLDSLSGMKMLSIKSSSLEDVTICASLGSFNLSSVCILAEKVRILTVQLRCYPSQIKSVIIETPNLQDMKWKVSVPHKCNIGDLRCLQNAELEPPYPDMVSACKWLELLNSVSSVQVLRLNISTIESLFIKHYLPIALERLHHLNIVAGYIKDAQVPAILSFLNGLLNLKTLSIIYGHRSYGSNWEQLIKLLSSRTRRFHREYGRSQHLLSDQLKEVKVYLGGGIPEIRLVKYLFMHAKGLEKMALVCSEAYYDKLTEKISSFKIASSAVSVSISYEKAYD